jgi:hypothetical protein
MRLVIRSRRSDVMANPMALNTPACGGTKTLSTAQLVGKAARVQWSAAAERYENAVARIDAALDAHATERSRNGRVGDVEDGVCDLLEGRAKRRRDIAHGGMCRRRVELDATAQRARIDVTEHDVRIGDGRRGAPTTEGSGPWLRACAARTHAECATIVDPRNAASAG